MNPPHEPTGPDTSPSPDAGPGDEDGSRPTAAQDRPLRPGEEYPPGFWGHPGADPCPERAIRFLVRTLIGAYALRWSLSPYKSPDHVDRPPAPIVGRDGRPDRTAWKRHVWTRVLRNCFLAGISPCDWLSHVCDPRRNPCPPPAEDFLEVDPEVVAALHRGDVRRIDLENREARHAVRSLNLSWPDSPGPDHVGVLRRDMNIRSMYGVPFATCWLAYNCGETEVMWHVMPLALGRYLGARALYDLGYARSFPEPLRRLADGVVALLASHDFDDGEVR